MMIDLFSDGPPNAHFATDAHGDATYAFELPGGGVIEARQASVSEGLGTGAVQWQAGTALAKALIASERDMKGKRIIELGCGCAALPAVVAATLGAEAVVATDVPILVPLLRDNIERYVQTPGVSAANQQALKTAMVARAMDWTQEEELRALASDARGYDVVLCADCVDESEALLAALCDTISACLAPTGAAVIASGARSQRLMALFLASLREAGLGVVELTSSLQPLPAAEASARARHSDETRFFAASWPDASTAVATRAARARGQTAASTLPAAPPPPDAHATPASAEASAEAPGESGESGVPAEVMAAMAGMMQQLSAIAAATSDDERNAQYDVLQAMLDEAGGGSGGGSTASAALQSSVVAAASEAEVDTAAASGAAPAHASGEEVGKPSLGVYAFERTRLVQVPLGPTAPPSSASAPPSSATAPPTPRTLLVEQHVDGPVPLEADGTHRRVWPTACILAKYLSQHQALIRGKRVVELGAGSGAVGLACAALGAASVTLTDQPEALPLIRANAERNAALIAAAAAAESGGSAAAASPGGAAVKVMPCTWGDEAHIGELLEANGGVPYDVVVCCEVVYKQSEPVLLALAHTQQRLMAKAKPGGVALLAYEYRGELFDDLAYFDAANELFEVEPLSLRAFEGDLLDEEYEDSRWLYTYTHKDKEAQGAPASSG